MAFGLSDRAFGNDSVFVIKLKRAWISFTCSCGHRVVFHSGLRGDFGTVRELRCRRAWWSTTLFQIRQYAQVSAIFPTMTTATATEVTALMTCVQQCIYFVLN